MKCFSSHALAFCRMLSGNVVDKSAMAETVEFFGVKDCTMIIWDKGRFPTKHFVPHGKAVVLYLAPPEKTRLISGEFEDVFDFEER